MKRIIYALVIVSFLISCSPKDKKNTADAAAT